MHPILAERTVDTYTPHSPNISGAETDAQLIEIWLHGKAANSQAAYRRDIQRFYRFVTVSLNQLTIRHLQAFADSLSDTAPNTQRRILSAVKSLISYGQKTGYLAFNVGAALKIPKAKNELAERILTEEEVIRMVTETRALRDKVILRLLYSSGGRVSEVANLRWKDCIENGDAGQVTFFGKGDETRAVPLSKTTWEVLLKLRGNAERDDPLFISQRGGPLTDNAIYRVVKKAGLRIGLEGVSPHWFRHSHASHALDRGASVALVRDTLGHKSLETTSKYLHAKPGESSSRFLVL